MRAVSVPFAVRTVVVLVHLVGLAVLGDTGLATGVLAAALVGVWAVPVVVRGERWRRRAPLPAAARAG